MDNNSIRVLIYASIPRSALVCSACPSSVALPAVQSRSCWLQTNNVKLYHIDNKQRIVALLFYIFLSGSFILYESPSGSTVVVDFFHAIIALRIVTKFRLEWKTAQYGRNRAGSNIGAGAGEPSFNYFELQIIAIRFMRTVSGFLTRV